MNFLKEIVKVPDKHLRAQNKNSLPVLGAIDEKRLKDTLLNNGRGVGLAAPQIGINRRVCVIQIETNEESKLLALHNPTFTHVTDEKIGIYEGCLSIPDKRVEVPRWNKVIVQYSNKWGRSMPLLELEGYEAIIVQHEIDHLEGVLITDYDNGITEKEYEELVKELEEKVAHEEN